MTIYDSSGAIVYEAPITASAVIKRVLMGDYYIELTFDAVERIDICRGCYILYNGHKFEIMSNVLPEDANNGGLRYTLRFEAQQSQMKRCKVFWRDSANLEVSFSNTTSLDHFGELIITNVNAFLGTNTWYLGSVPADLKKTLKTVSFNGDTCWDAVANIAETFGVEWWTEENGDNISLCFGKLEYGTEVEFKKGDIVSSIPSKKGDSANYGTRFYVFGSTKNLPADYASTDEGGIVNHIVEKRLHLPDGRRYIDAWDNLAKEDIVEQVVFFDDIYPTNVDTVTSVTKESGTPIEGRFDFIYTVYCANTPFTPDYIIEGEQIQATFTSGDLVGQTFDVEVNTTSFDKRFRIVPNVLDAENGILLPNDSSNPKEGDTFILTGIQLPKERIEEAEQSLLEAGIEYAKKNSSDTEVYDCPTNAVYCHKNNCNYDLGQKVVLVGDKFGSGRSSRIQGYEKKLYDQYQATYTVGDNSAYSRLASVEKAIQKSSYADRVGLEANIIRSKSDSTIPSDFNVYSALATLEYFLHKNRGGIVKGHTDFAKGISIYGKEVGYNKKENAIILPTNLIVEGGIAWNSRFKDFTEEEIFSITQAINYDPMTLAINEYGQLTVIGGAGSGTTSGITQEQLQSYLVVNKYITQPVLADTLTPYAKTEVVNSLLTDYLPKSGTATNADMLDNLHASAFVRVDRYPEVSDNNWNIPDGIYGTYNGTEGLPYSNVGHHVIHCNWDANAANQLFLAYDKDVFSFRRKQGNVWQPWRTIAFADNDTLSPASGTLTVNGNIEATGNISAQSVIINGKPISYNASKNTFILPANLLVEGGIAWNSRFENFTDDEIFTITNAVSIDGTSIIRDGGVLCVNPDYVQSVGGLDENELHNYLTANKYITQRTLADTLTPYATTTDVNSLLTDYLPKSGGTMTGQIFLDAKGWYPSFAYKNNGVRYGEIGFSAKGVAAVYDETTWRTILHSGNYSNYALPITGGTISGSITADSFIGNLAGTAENANTLNGIESTGFALVKGYPSASPDNYSLQSGIYSINGNVDDLPLSYHGNHVIHCNWDANAANQLFLAYNKDLFAFRRKQGVAWQPWRTIAFADNDTLSPASGTLTVNSNVIAQNVTATTNVTATNALITGGTAYASALKSKSICIECGQNGAYDSKYDGNINRFGGALWIQASSGNDLYLGGTYANTTILSTLEVNKAATFKETLTATTQMMIGSSDAPSQALEVRGNILATGQIAWNSSRALKTEIKEHYLSLEKLAQIKPYQYKWKDGRDDLVHVGAIADEVMDIMPETVLTDTLGIHSMDYAQTAFVMAASLTPHVSDHERRIKDLETENKALKQEIEKLKRAA